MARFTKKPGAVILPSTEVEGMALVSVDPVIPDDVKLPEPLGGEIVRVITHGYKACPGCQHVVLHLILEYDYGVSECAVCGFLWYRRHD